MAIEKELLSRSSYSAEGSWPNWWEQYNVTNDHHGVFFITFLTNSFPSIARSLPVRRAELRHDAPLLKKDIQPELATVPAYLRVGGVIGLPEQGGSASDAAATAPSKRRMRARFVNTGRVVMGGTNYGHPEGGRHGGRKHTRVRDFGGAGGKEDEKRGSSLGMIEHHLSRVGKELAFSATERHGRPPCASVCKVVGVAVATSRAFHFLFISYASCG